MEEARQVLERLERIERLKEAGAPVPTLLAEVRRLLEEGERWLAAERVGVERARDALGCCRLRIEEIERLKQGEVVAGAAL